VSGSKYTRSVSDALFQLAKGWDDRFRLPFEPGYSRCYAMELGDLCGGCDSCLELQAHHWEHELEQDERRRRRQSARAGFLFVRNRTSASELSARIKEQSK
jgi:hypothetical protein